MFDRLIDILASFWESLLPFKVIDQTHNGIVMRLGLFKKALQPGFHWVVPFVDAVEHDNVVTRICEMQTQSLVTRDGVEVLVSVNLQWRINDYVGSALKIENVSKAIPAACAGVVFGFIKNRNWQYFLEAEAETLNQELKELCRKRVQRYGALIEESEFRDLSRSSTLRLINTDGLTPADRTEED